MKKIAFFCLFSSLIIIGVTHDVPQALYGDPAMQLVAVQQYASGDSPTPNHIVVPDSRDLAQNSTNWIEWWPPGTQIFITPLLLLGMDIGSAVRVLVVSCFLAGTIGWIYWFGLFKVPYRILAIFAISLPWIRYANNGFFIYSAESLSFAVGPWMLVIAIKVLPVLKKESIDSKGVVILVMYGILLGSAYILKYSLVFISAGIYFFFVTTVFSHVCKSDKTQPLVNLLCVGVSLAAPIIMLTYLNHTMGGAGNSLLSSLELSIDYRDFLFLMSSPALATMDANSVFNYVFMHPDKGLFKSQELSLVIVGFPGTVYILWAVRRYKLVERFSVEDLLSVYVFFTGLLLVFCVWSLSNAAADRDARHFSIFSLAVLPFFLKILCRQWSCENRIWKFATSAWVAVFLVLPVFYGIVSVFGKVYRIQGEYVTSISGTYNVLFADKNADTVLTSILDDYKPGKDIWYLTSAAIALDVPGRKIIAPADFVGIEILSKAKYMGTAPFRIRALIPEHFNKNGKTKVVKESFKQIESWTELPIEGSHLVLWIGEIGA